MDMQDHQNLEFYQKRLENEVFLDESLNKDEMMMKLLQRDRREQEIIDESFRIFEEMKLE